MNNEYRENHFVPRGYLKGFTITKNKLFRLKLNPGKYEKVIMERGLKQIAFEKDLYTINDDRIYQEFDIPKDDKFIEKNCFEEIENKIAQCVSRFSKLDVTEEDRRLICEFIFISILRNPNRIDLIKKHINPDFKENWLDENREIIERSKGLVGDNRTFAEIKADCLRLASKMSIFKPENLSKNSFLQTILDFSRNPENLAKVLCEQNINRRFTIYEATGSVDFITSNFPAFSCQPGVGFNDNLRPTSSFSIPLSRRLMLEIDRGIKEFGEEGLVRKRLIDDFRVDLFNYITIQNSEGEVYGPSKEQLERYVSKEYIEAVRPTYEKAAKMAKFKKNT